MKKNFTPKQLNILDIAEELIADKGFESTTVREIAAKAKINVAMISYYFGSKYNMMISLYEYRVQRTKDDFLKFMLTLEYASPEAKLKEIIEYIIKQLMKYRYFHGFVNQELRYDESVKDYLLDFYETCIEVLDNVIRSGLQTGVFKRAANSEDILSSIIGMVVFVVRNKSFYKKFLDGANADYLANSENKLIKYLNQTVFSLLGFFNI